MKKIILRLLHLSTNHSSIHNHTLHIYRIGGGTCWIWRLDRAQVPISLWVWIQTNHLVYGVNRTSPAPLAPALWMIRVDCFISHIFLTRADSQNVLISDMEAMNPTSNLPCPAQLQPSHPGDHSNLFPMAFGGKMRGFKGASLLTYGNQMWCDPEVDSQPMKCVLIRSIPIIPWPPNSICFP